jgi:hypothetical protein
LLERERVVPESEDRGSGQSEKGEERPPNTQVVADDGFDAHPTGHALHALFRLVIGVTFVEWCSHGRFSTHASAQEGFTDQRPPFAF